MKKLIYIIIAFLLVLGVNVYAEDAKITLNDAITDDVNHTFKYPNFDIDESVNPYSITLSIENGYFSTNNSEDNDKVLTYFNFMGGTNTSNAYISTLNTTEKFELITFNLKNTVDLADDAQKGNVITSIINFLRNITFYNDLNKDAKFSLTLSDVELTFQDDSINSGNDLNVIAFKDPSQKTEHYYMRVDDQSIDWHDAYNIATELEWNGLQGYLVTITTEAEHNFIYKSLGSFYGWMGAASIKNAGDITYNQKDIAWNPAYDKLPSSGEYGHNDELDAKIESYWYWVAGPEAGQKLFDGYTNFNVNEPNNCGGYEWTGQYGNGADGSWNDFKSNEVAIAGYYVEFGGFEDEEATVKPVSLVNTFKWKDYDFRNIETTIEDELEDAEFDDTVTLEDIKEVLDDAIEETGVEDATYNVVSKTIEGTTLTIKIEVLIGEDDARVKYELTITKEIEISEPEPEEEPPIEEPEPEEEPPIEEPEPEEESPIEEPEPEEESPVEEPEEEPIIEEPEEEIIEPPDTGIIIKYALSLSVIILLTLVVVYYKKK